MLVPVVLSWYANKRRDAEEKKREKTGGSVSKSFRVHILEPL